MKRLIFGHQVNSSTGQLLCCLHKSNNISRFRALFQVPCQLQKMT